MASGETLADFRFNNGMVLPSILDHIKRILHQYPDDGHILKELIQNADDAGATEVNFVLDYTQYPTEHLFSPDMRQYQGPALLAYNNAKFTVEDWRGIVMLDKSIKENDLLKVGRFGLGFKSIFHITDVPSVVSGDGVAFLDPHQHLFRKNGNGKKGGFTSSYKWHFTDDADYMASIPDQWAPYKHELFNLHDVNVFPSDGQYENTMFRFPLRRPNAEAESELSDKEYTADKMEEMFCSLIEEGHLYLLFLRHVESIELYRQGERIEGKRNEGERNEGERNEGKRNEGERNEGERNEGKRNEKRNECEKNEGERNVGKRNEGERNEGERNEGEKNEGERNEGEKNEGERNEGEKNEGERNEGKGKHDRERDGAANFNQDDTKPRLLYRIRISPSCLENVRMERKQLLQDLKVGRESTHTYDLSLDVEIFGEMENNEVHTKGTGKNTEDREEKMEETREQNIEKKTYTYLMCQHSAAASTHERQQHLPLVGTALPLHTVSQGGQLFCFLPLPLEQSPSGLNVHLNGYFGVEQNRRHIKWPTAGQVKLTDDILLWNMYLLTELLPAALSSLAQYAAVEKANGTNMDLTRDVYYGLFPDEKKVKVQWQPLVEKFYGQAATARSPALFFPWDERAAPVRCSDPRTIFIHDDEHRDLLCRVLSANRHNAVVVPEHVLCGLQHHAASVRTVDTSALYTSLLTVQDQIELTEEERFSLFRMLAPDNKLKGLKLLPTLDGEVAVFSENGPVVYVDDPEFPAKLLPHAPQKFIADHLPTDVRETLTSLADQGKYQLRGFTKETVARELVETFKSISPKTEDLLVSQPRFITMEWMERVWGFLNYYYPNNLEDFDDLPVILVTSENKLCRLSTKAVVMVERGKNGENLAKELQVVLSKLKVTIVSDIPDFVLRHPYVPVLQPSQLGEAIKQVNNHLDTQDISLVSLIQDLSPEQKQILIMGVLKLSKTEVDGIIDILCTLPLLQTVENSGNKPSQFVSAAMVTHAAPREVFPIPLPEQLIQLSTPQEEAFARLIKLPQMSTVEVMMKIIPQVKSQKDAESIAEMVEKRLHEFFSHDGFREVMSTLKFVSTKKKDLFPPCDLIQSNDCQLNKLLEEIDIVPQGKFRDPTYLPMLRQLGLKTGPTAVEIYRIALRIQELNLQSIEKKMEAARLARILLPFLEEFFEKYRAEYIQTENGSMTLENALQYVSYLPVVQATHPDYPPSLPWLGEQSFTVSPQEGVDEKFAAVCASTCLLRSASIIIPAQKPKLESVVQHLKNCMQNPTDDIGHVAPKIYKFLYDEDKEACINVKEELRKGELQDWVWKDGKFYSAEEMVVSSPTIKVEPYIHTLPREYVGFKGLFEQCGTKEHCCYTDVLQRIKQFHDVGDVSDEDRQLDLQMVVSILTDLSNKAEMDEVSRSQVLLPTLNHDKSLGDQLQLLPLDECVYCDEDWFKIGINLSDLLGNEESDDDNHERMPIHLVHPQIPMATCTRLGVPNIMSKVPIDLVLQQLNTIKKSSMQDRKNLEAILREVYKYLQDYIKDETHSTARLEQLKEDNILLADGIPRFVEAKEVALSLDYSCDPYLFKLPRDFERDFPDLLRFLGVKEQFSEVDFSRVLQALYEKHQETVLQKDEQSLVINIARMMYSLKNTVDLILPDLILPEQDPIYLLNQAGIMCESSKLCYDDCPWLPALDPKKLCHKEIVFPHAYYLRVKRKQEVRVDGQRVGMPFGQKEKLVGRLRRLLEGYPCDIEIFKELLQNADDARATEIHFIIDPRTHESESLINDKWKNLQGPALLVYSDKPFSEQDLIGIQSLGEGSKADDALKTGKYGVGFNCVYHVTDTPTVLTTVEGQGKRLCAFDPRCKYVGAPESPGEMYKVDESLIADFPDMFSCYMLDNPALDTDCGTLFRLPFRTGLEKNDMDSQFSDKVLSPSKMEAMFTKFMPQLSELLLFINSVTKVKLSKVDEQTGILQSLCEVHATLSDEASERKQEFQDHVAKKMLAIRTDSKGLKNVWNAHDIVYEIDITQTRNNEENSEEMTTEKETWHIAQQFGIDDKNSVDKKLEKALKDKKLCLCPQGGVAYKWAPLKNLKEKNEHERQDNKIFCFLPLPVTTDLPVHINGTFALSSELRHDIADDKRYPPAHWNDLMYRSVIASAYVNLIIYRKKVLQTEGDEDSIAQQLESYFHLFPHVPSEEMEKNLKRQYPLREGVYQRIHKKKEFLLPMVRRKIGDTTVKVSWHPVDATNGAVTYFDPVEEKAPCQPIQTGAMTNRSPSTRPSEPNQPGTSAVCDSEPGTSAACDSEPNQPVTSAVCDSEPGTSAACDSEPHQPGTSAVCYSEPGTSAVCDSEPENQTAISAPTENLRSQLIQTLICCGMVVIQDPVRILTHFQLCCVPASALSPQCVEKFFRDEEKKLSWIQDLPCTIDNTPIETLSNLVALCHYLLQPSNSACSLSNLPIVLTRDNVLQVLQEQSTVFYTEHYLAVPSIYDCILHEQLLDVLPPENFRTLTMSEFGKMLEKMKMKKTLPTAFQGTEVKMKFTELPADLQTKGWLSRVWRFVQESLTSTTPSTGAQLDLNKITPINNFALFPCTHNKQDYLISVGKASTVLHLPDQSEDTPYTKALRKLPIQEAAFNLLEEDNMDATVLQSLVATIHHPDRVLLSLHEIRKDISQMIEELKSLPEKERIKRELTCTERKSIVKYFADNLKKLGKGKDTKETLRSLPLYETVKGRAVALQGRCCIVPQGIPTNEQDVFESSGVTFVMDDPGLSDLYTYLGCHVNSEIIQKHIVDFCNQVKKTKDLKIREENAENLVRFLFSSKDRPQEMFEAIRKIEFLPQKEITKDKLDICAQSVPKDRLVSFEKAMFADQANFVWSCCPTIPEKLHPTHFLERTIDQWENGERCTVDWKIKERQKHISKILSWLKVKVVTPMDVVAQHVENLCRGADTKIHACSKTDERKKVYETLKQVLFKIFRHIEERLSEFDKELFKAKTILPVKTDDEVYFAKASQIMKAGEEIIPYLFKVPLDFGLYFDLFVRMGAVKEASADTYSGVLKDIHQQSKGLKLNANEKEAVMKCCIVLSQIGKHDPKKMLELNSETELFLLGEDGKLHLSSTLVWKDKPSLYARTKGFERVFLAKDQHGRLKLKSLVNKLPMSMKPQQLSALVVECMDTEFRRSDTPSPAAQALQERLASPEFFEGLCRVAEWERSKQETGAEIPIDHEELQRKVNGIHVITVQELQTHLVYKKKVPSSEETKDVFIKSGADEIYVHFATKAINDIVPDIEPHIRKKCGIEHKRHVQMLLTVSLERINRKLTEADIPELNCADGVPSRFLPRCGEYVRMEDQEMLEPLLVTTIPKDGDFVALRQGNSNDEDNQESVYYIYAKVIKQKNPDEPDLLKRVFEVDNGEKIIKTFLSQLRCIIRIQEQEVKEQDHEGEGEGDVGGRKWRNHYGRQHHARRSPNPQPAAASRWLKQAHRDLAAANSDAHLANEWVVFKAHQASEKALRASQVYSDADQKHTRCLPDACWKDDGTLKNAATELQCIVGQNVMEVCYPRYYYNLEHPSDEDASRSQELAKLIVIKASQFCGYFTPLARADSASVANAQGPST